jgi:hypothetical protein
MSQYTTGNVTLKQNSATVIGASTNFLTASNVKVGDLFKRLNENAWYQVTSVNLATNLNISPVYAAANASNVDYIIARDFTTNLDLPELTSGDSDWQDVYTRSLRAIDAKFFQVEVATPNTNHTVAASQEVVLASGTAGNFVTVTLPRASNRRRLYIGLRSNVATLKVLASSPPDYIASGGSTLASIIRTGQHSTVTVIGDGGNLYYIF